MHCFIPQRGRCGGAHGALLGLLALLWSLLPGATHAAEAPRLVRDINATTTDTNGSMPQSLAVVAGKTAYFTASSPLYGTELWKSDGTAAGTVMVKDINPGMLSSSPWSLAAVGSMLYFQADDGLHGPELWKSDGTAAGTVMVKEIMPDLYSPQIMTPTPVRGMVMFAANDGPHGIELWKSDGTAAGTCLVKDIHPLHSGYPSSFNVINDTLYFFANAPADNSSYSPTTPWKSDGTAAGTVKVNLPDANIDDLGSVKGRLFYSTFAYYNTYAVRHVWLSDGTAAGSRQIASMQSFTPLNLDPSSVAATLPNGVIHFLNCDPQRTVSLWRSDGTTQGTRLVKTLSAAPGGNAIDFYSPQLLAFNGALYFCVGDATHGKELWKSDGTAAGTVLVKDINPGAESSAPAKLTVAGGKLYFTADDGVHGRELWRTDDAAGAVMVKDITAGNALSSDYYKDPSPRELWEVNGKLIFIASDGVHGREVWVSDGTAAGTRMLKDIYVGSNAIYREPMACGQRAVYFSANDGVHGQELWRSDGRSAALVKDLRPGAESGLMTYTDSRPIPISSTAIRFTTNKIYMNDALYFGATDGTHGAGLYRCDGATGSVAALKDGMSDLSLLGKIGTKLLFSQMGLKYSLEIWSSDGTQAGTTLVRQFSPDTTLGSVGFSSKPAVATLKGVLYFSSQGGSYYYPGLWRSDGTAAGTMRVSPMTLTSPTDSSYRYNTTPGVIKAAGGKLYMIASGRLWVSDGTAAGTRPVSWKTGYVAASQLETMGGKAYFSGSYWNDGTPQSDELWVSDGTEAGTRQLKDIWPGVVNSHPQELLAVGNKLFFTASDPVSGAELWVSDGTEAGTRLVKDIAPGQTGSHPQGLTAAGGQVLFSAYDPQHGNELWISDGTAAGTRLAVDVTPGPLGSNPMEMTLLGDTVLFSAVNPANLAQGREPWSWRIGVLNAVRGWTRYGD